MPPMPKTVARLLPLRIGSRTSMPSSVTSYWICSSLCQPVRPRQVEAQRGERLQRRPSLDVRAGRPGGPPAGSRPRRRSGGGRMGACGRGPRRVGERGRVAAKAGDQAEAVARDGVRRRRERPAVGEAGIVDAGHSPAAPCGRSRRVDPEAAGRRVRVAPLARGLVGLLPLAVEGEEAEQLARLELEARLELPLACRRRPGTRPRSPRSAGRPTSTSSGS